MSNNTTAIMIGIIFLFGLFAGGGAVYLFSNGDSTNDTEIVDLNSGEEIVEDDSQEDTNQPDNQSAESDDIDTQSNITSPPSDSSDDNDNTSNESNETMDSEETVPLEEQCLGGHSNLAMHIHPWINLTVRGTEVLLPADMGIDTSVCPGAMHLLHTHDDSGKLHVETYEPITLNLSLFFEVWNISESENSVFDPLFLDPDNVTISVDGIDQTLGINEIIFEDGIFIDIVYQDSLPDSDGDGVDDDSDLCEGYNDNTDWDNDGVPDGCDDDDDGDGVNDINDICPNTPPSATVNESGCTVNSDDSDSVPLKILALHGGGETASGLSSQQGMQDLMNALPEFEFVFASTPENNNVWIRDPPGGKGEPTTDPDWADTSISYLDQVVIDDGPFYALLGYSQGAAMVPVYLANTDNTFNRVMMYNGYLPTSHEGLIDTIEAVEPFTTPAMVFSGENDDWFKDLSPALAEKFTNSLDLHSQTAAHHLPYQDDEHFQSILTFIREGIAPYDPSDLGLFWVDKFLCQNGTGVGVDDYNTSGDDNHICEVTITLGNDTVTITSNGIPNHDLESGPGCCASSQSYTWVVPRSPSPDNTGGHDSTNCPEANGDYQCVADRGDIAIAINGVPIFGPEDGPGGDAVASNEGVYEEDRQHIWLGLCHGHSGPGGVYHYHADGNCVHWHPDEAAGEGWRDYSFPSSTNTGEASDVIGIAFDGYPIYGVYGDDGTGQIVEMKSSYRLKSGETGYNGIDDYEYVSGLGHLDVCNGHFGPTPDFPDGIYHYHSTMYNGIGEMGFPYFLICYHGVVSDDGGTGDGSDPCAGRGETWGPGIGPPPDGCEGGGPGQQSTDTNVVDQQLALDWTNLVVLTILSVIGLRIFRKRS